MFLTAKENLSVAACVVVVILFIRLYSVLLSCSLLLRRTLV